ncbi:hypothetical protein OIU77_019039 [Salix suchowensis]|uniref:Uncharacterized protein n=1 Tax=Salix suchowensis TaxID=1278906 RepID=A0ABQ9CEP6_9ROSI|nr:hypothetical protein OIU77_019039 [Salix suchowensis]
MIYISTKKENPQTDNGFREI